MSLIQKYEKIFQDGSRCQKPYQMNGKNSWISTTPQKENKDFFHPKSNQKPILNQFPVQMQHIRLNQLEQNYTMLTPQSNLTKGQINNNQVITKHQQSSVSQLHHCNESVNPVNRINVNLSLKQFQQQPLKQVHQNSSQKTPVGSSSKNSQPQHYHQVTSESSHYSNMKLGLSKDNQNSQSSHDLQQQIHDLRRQKENICITLSETFKKNQILNCQVQELQKQLQQQQFDQEGLNQNQIDSLKDKIIELTNANTNISNISSQYSIKLQQLETQVRQNRQTDLKKIQELVEESKRLQHDKDELQEEGKQLRKNRNEVLEMNQSLENELKETVGQYAVLQNDANQLQEQLQELYQENLTLKEVKINKNDDPQVRNLMEGQKLIAKTMINDQKNISFQINDSIDTDISDHHSMQINQMNGIIEMLKNENQILYTALNRQCLST